MRLGDGEGRRRHDEDSSVFVGSHQRGFNPSQGEVFDRAQAGSRRIDTNAVIRHHLEALEETLHDDPVLQRLKLDDEKMKRQFKKFRSRVQITETGSSSNALVDRLRQLADLKDGRGIEQELQYAFYGAMTSSNVKISDAQFQQRLLNLKYPSEWYPRTRGFQREFHVHVGPTNSGKTYHALKRLEEAQRGVYAGPLRLLAHEVYMRLNARGKPCNLVTGDERKTHADSKNDNVMMSCTVEMVPLDEVFDVAVIDEIQMIGSEDRGWAWTSALLGVMAREVHLCGEERAVPIIEELAAACGETVKIHRYERLSPLEVMPRSLEGNLSQLQKGDCLVGFSIVVLHSLRQYVERVTKKKCAIIYGTLPPETRAQQAKLFNDPDNEYDYLIASNAVGMGLNLSIKRLIFQSAYRNIRGKYEAISVPEIKQIAGRAGRYSTASEDMESTIKVSDDSDIQPAQTTTVQETDALHAMQQGDAVNSETRERTYIDQPSAKLATQSASSTQQQPERSSRNDHTSSDVAFATSSDATTAAAVNGLTTTPPPSKPQNLGLVTTLEKLDHAVVANAMRTDPLPMTSAGVIPPNTVIEQFSRYFPAGTPLAFLLLRIKEIAGTSRRFFLCDIKTSVAIADAIECVSGLNISDRLEFCAAPIETRREGEAELARAYAAMVGESRPGTILDLKELDIELLEEDYQANKEYLRKLENLHKGVIIFNWLAFRFTGVFLNQPLATHVKELVEKRIEETLGKMSFDYHSIRKNRDQALLDLLEDKEDKPEPAPHSTDSTYTNILDGSPDSTIELTNAAKRQPEGSNDSFGDSGTPEGPEQDLDLVSTEPDAGSVQSPDRASSKQSTWSRDTNHPALRSLLYRPGPDQAETPL